MARIPLVRCYLLERGAEAGDRELRYVPYSEFDLWEYMMTHKYERRVLEPEESIWVDELERKRLAGIYDRHDTEPVHRIRILRYLEHPRMLVPLYRYFPEQDYERLKKHFLYEHQGEFQAIKGLGLSAPVEETPGFWVRRKKKPRRTTEVKAPPA